MIVDNVDNFAAYAILLGENAFRGVDYQSMELFTYVDGWPCLNTKVDNARICCLLIYGLSVGF